MTTMIYTWKNDTIRVENPDKRAVARWINQLDRQNRFHIRFSNATGTLSVQGGNYGTLRVGVQLNEPSTGQGIGRLINPDYQTEASGSSALFSADYVNWIPMRFNVSKDTAIEVAAHFAETARLPEGFKWDWQ